MGIQIVTRPKPNKPLHLTTRLRASQVPLFHYALAAVEAKRCLSSISLLQEFGMMAVKGGER